MALLPISSTGVISHTQCSGLGETHMSPNQCLTFDPSPQDFGKSYFTGEEAMQRLAIWTSNKKYVELHNANADVYGFTLAMNEYADLVSGCGCVGATYDLCVVGRC